ncbi:MAG: hypothetical protein V1738_03655 [Patescibacteria group bacterium]
MSQSDINHQPKETEKDLFPEIGRFLLLLVEGKGGTVRAREVGLLVMARLPAYVDDDKYLSYCILTASAFDILNSMEGRGSYFDLSAISVLSHLQDRKHFHETSRDAVISAVVSREVRSFVLLVRARLSELCWHVMNPDLYGEPDQLKWSLLTNTLAAIPDDDPDKHSCEVAFYFVSGVLKPPNDDFSDALDAVESIGRRN